MSLRGSCELKVLPWIFWCHGRRMFFSEGQSGNMPALLPKPYYKLDGFRVGRRGGLRRRFELEIGGCYTYDLLASLFWKPLGECGKKYCPLIPAASCTCCQTYEITGIDGPLVCSTSPLVSPVSFIDFHFF